MPPSLVENANQEIFRDPPIRNWRGLSWRGRLSGPCTSCGDSGTARSKTPLAFGAFDGKLYWRKPHVLAAVPLLDDLVEIERPKRKGKCQAGGAAA